MKTLKKTLCLLLALVLLLCSAPAAFAADVVASGTCGKNGSNLTWSLDSEGTLTIGGEGQMSNYGSTWDNGVDRTNAPWGKYYKTIQSVVIGNSVTSIGNSAFFGCTALESVTIGDSVTSIGSSAFSRCTSLESVTIPDSVTSIGEYAFFGCTVLESVMIPDSVTSIGNRAFNLQSIVVSASNHNYSSANGILYNKAKTTLIQCPGTKTEVAIPNSVTNIGSYAFFGCTVLENVTIPDSVTSIGEYAFLGCTSLESVTIPDSVTCIGNSVFYNCTALESVTLGNSVTSMGEYVFWGCSMNSIILPDNIENFGYRSLYKECYDSGESSYVIYILPFCNKGTTTAETLANHGYPLVFLDGTDEDNLIQEKVNAKLSFTVDKLTRTLTVQNDGAMVSFASYAAPWQKYNEYIANMVILPGCTSVSNSAFRYLTNLKHVSLPEGIETIGSFAFDNCAALTTILLPNGLKTVSDSAFRFCHNLPEMIIPDTVTSIGAYAFERCRRLNSIVIPSSITSINFQTFCDCYALESIVIPDSVTSIGSRAFSGCYALKTAVIGNGVQEISEYAFSGCSSLGSVKIGDNVKEIGQNAFSGCSFLSTVVLPERVKTLSSRSFPENALKDLYIYNVGQCDIAEDAVFYSATIHAYADSPAAVFFENNGYSFEPLTDAPAHEHDSTPVKGTAPTCTDAGLTDGYRCSICGKWITKQKPIKALGHDYVLKETVLPTNTENGFKRYECSRCDATYTEVIPVSSHAHNYTVTDSRPATCTEDGFASYVCYGCGHTYTDIFDALDHSFGAWKTFLPVEAGQAGIDVRFCSRCGVYELRESEAVGTGTTPTDPNHEHTFVQVESKDPDCENAGYVRYLCSCGAGKAEIKAALGHDMQIGPYVPETCTTDGYTPWVCTRCGKETRTDLVSAPGHQWDGGTVTRKPTCSGLGVVLYTCTREGCGETMVKELGKDPNGHVFKVTVVAPTCADEGFTSHACTLCRYGYSDSIVPALGHNFKVQNEVKPTCTEQGTTTEACTRCGEEQYAIVAPLGHIDENDDGKCDRCKEKLADAAEEEEDLNFFQRIVQWFENLFAKLFGKK